MKIFFDTNVYVAEALLGRAARRMIEATHRAKWRTYVSRYLLNELTHVLVDDLRFSRRLAELAKRRIVRRSLFTRTQSKAQVPNDPKDSPILQSALTCGSDYLVTNDRHLLSLDPFESLRIISMDQYHLLLEDHGVL